MGLKNELINWLKSNYEKMPEPLVYIIGKMGNQFGYSVRYGRTFADTYKEISEAEYLSETEINQIVFNKIKSTVEYARENVPFYENAYSLVGPINSIDEFEKLPFIDKSIVKNNEDSFISNLFQKEKLIQKKTSGSTGMPLAVYMNRDTTLKEWAFVVHIWERIGFNSKSSRILMREIEDKSKGICYFDAIKNELRIDISSMTDENLRVYCHAIEKYKPDFIHGYPSATLQLCKYIEKHKIDHQFKGVLPSSEGINKEEFEYIQRILKCPILSFYGHTERLAMAGQCEKSDYYHVEPLYGYVELIDDSGKVIKEEGITGEIVATGFCNTGMPLIRYKTGDLAQWSLEKCSCGRKYKLLKKIEGRTMEYLVDCEGNKISLTSFRYSFYERHVKVFQFYQNERGYVTFRAIIEEEFSEEDKSIIIQTLEEDANYLIKFRFEVCESLSKKKSGKREIIIQELKL